MNEPVINTLSQIPPYRANLPVYLVRELIVDAFQEGYDAHRQDLDDAEDAESEFTDVAVVTCSELTITPGPKSPPPVRYYDATDVELVICGIPIKCSDSDFDYFSIEKGDWADDLAEQTVSEDVTRRQRAKQIAADLRTAHQKGRDEYKAEQDRKYTEGAFHSSKWRTRMLTPPGVYRIDPITFYSSPLTPDWIEWSLPVQSVFYTEIQRGEN